jgi:hypothetical protein
MYDIIKIEKITPTSTANLKLLKAKIVRSHCQNLGETMHDTAPADCINVVHPTLYQLVKRQKRQTSRLFRCVRDSNGNIQTVTATYRHPPGELLQHSLTFYKKKYTNIVADPESIRILASTIQTTTVNQTTSELETPLQFLKSTMTSSPVEKIEHQVVTE